MIFETLINNVKKIFTRNQQKEALQAPADPWDNLTLGDRMKLYESFFTGKNFPGKYPNWPQRNAIRIPGGWPFGLNGYTEVPDGFYPVIRVDGHCFSTFTRQFEKPYDMRIINAMKDATIKLVDVFHALLGYTQSDEITIVLPQDAELFGRKCQKIATLAASTAAVAFYDSLLKSGYSGNLPAFDARTFGVPNIDEAANCIIWRERDAIKNSISNVARKFYSDKELLNKNSDDKIKMMADKGYDFWTQTLLSFARGMYIKRIVETRPYTPEELEKLPPKHQARLAPDSTLMCTRSKFVQMEYPLATHIANLPDVLFGDAEPVLKEGIANLHPFETNKETA